MGHLHRPLSVDARWASVQTAVASAPCRSLCIPRFMKLVWPPAAAQTANAHCERTENEPWEALAAPSTIVKKAFFSVERTFTHIREGLLDHKCKLLDSVSAVRVRRWQIVPVLWDQSWKPGNNFRSMLYGRNLVHATPPRSAVVHELVDVHRHQV